MKKLFNNSTKGNDTQNKSSKSKLNFLKTFSFTSLALLMGIAGTMAFAPLSNTPLSGNLNVSAQEQNFDLGLRPETDPVVYVTESGLEIKKSNGKYTSTTTTTTNTGYTYTQDLTSFYYFTMGTFSGTIYTAKNRTDTYEVSNEPVNWLIIGRGEFNFYDDSPAGTAIKNESSKQQIAIFQNYLPMSMSTIPKNAEEIPENCFLVLSEKLLGQMYFNASGNLNAGFYTGYSPSYWVYGNGYYGNRYRYYGTTNTTAAGGQSWNATSSNKGGDLYNYINSLMCVTSPTNKAITGSNKLGFTQSQANLIVPQQLYTYYSNGSGYNYAETPSTDGGTYYSLFPLAYRAASTGTKQNFCIEDYLTTNAQRTATFIGSSTNQAFFWWLRSGYPYDSYSTANVEPSGECSYNSVNRSNGARPAMVMRLQ